MSDDERSDSSSESEDLETTGLIATRAKRATAGNLYATLRANLDDEELQKELLAEDEEGDAVDYEGSDAGDDDEAFESSSDEEDAGPPQEGDAEELEGEKALKRQERVEAKKKRKVHEARLKLPAYRKQVKRVKLADDVKTEDGSGVEVVKPKKKSERSNWLPAPADAPMRQSRRSLAVANREVVHANLKQSAARSENQKRIMKNAAEREKKEKITASLTQEERLKKCEKIERETAREFGRWEREEAERQRLREEALAAKRRRGIDGPVIRVWSGSVLWEGEKVKVKRVAHGSQKVEEIVEKKVEPEPGHGEETTTTEVSTPVTTNETTGAAPSPIDTQAKSTPEVLSIAPVPIQAQDTAAPLPAPWLQGIQEYAAKPPHTPTQPPYTPSNPSINNTPTVPVIQQSNLPPAPPQPQMYHGWPPGSHQFPLHPPPPITTAPPPPPPIPLIREQAQRTLLILDSFPSLETPATATKRGSKSKQPETTPLNPDALTTTLLPDSHPTFTPEESRYLTTRPRRRLIPGGGTTPTFTTTNAPLPLPSGPRYEVPLPPPPARTKCAVTSWPAKFRDPKTNLGYADMHQYKVIQRALAGGCLWSGLLGAWVGPSYGRMGRPAKGVPEGFAGGLTKAKVKVEGGA